MRESIIGKKVIYNGGTLSYYGSSDHNLLVKGKRYVVRDVYIKDWQTDYKLEGVVGWFNSYWFNEAKSLKKWFLSLFSRKKR